MYVHLMAATRNLPSQPISNLISSHMPRPSKFYHCQWADDLCVIAVLVLDINFAVSLSLYV